MKKKSEQQNEEFFLYIVIDSLKKIDLQIRNQFRDLLLI